MKELLGKKEIEALVNCKPTEFKKCIKCGKKYNIRTKEKIKWCGKCGRRLDFYVNELLGMDKKIPQDNQEDIKRQWLEALGAGWPCEVWPDEKIIKKLMYFSVMKLEACYFVEKDIEVMGCNNTPEDYLCYYKNYRPLSTPLDFIYEREKKIEIHPCGIWRSIDEYGAAGNWKPWQNCPKGMRGKIFRIPDDWRPK